MCFATDPVRNQETFPGSAFREYLYSIITARQRSGEVNVFSRVCLSVCSHHGEGFHARVPNPPTMFNLELTVQGPQTCSNLFTCHPYCRQAVSWHSTECLNVLPISVLVCDCERCLSYEGRVDTNFAA